MNTHRVKHSDRGERDGPRRRVGRGAASLALLALAWALVPGLATAETTDPVKLRAQLGIIYAQNGNHEGAHREFVKLLEVPEGRAVALTNLGNLAFLDGRVDEAVESYRQAAALDTGDPGVLLNQGLALKTLGMSDEADASFAAAVEMAGGVEQAQYLLGLHTDDDEGRGKVSKMTSAELKQLLAKAKAKVPETDGKKKGEEAPKVTSRPGGVRADEQVGEQNLYWKER